MDAADIPSGPWTGFSHYGVGTAFAKDDLTHCQKIVIALAETIRLMAETAAVIAEHGGWPGAFSKRE